MISGVNHITLAVADVGQSFDFYVGILGLRPVARWKRGAYLCAGDTWIALFKDDRVRDAVRPDYSHVALSCAAGDFSALADRLSRNGAKAWSENGSEGESFYFEDPDGHQLEIHVGDLDSRLAAMKHDPWDELELFEPS